MKVLTAHRKLGPLPGTYRRGWEIIDEEGEIVAECDTKFEARMIIDRQMHASIGSTPATLRKRT